jgi:hypothetical protein
MPADGPACFIGGLESDCKLDYFIEVEINSIKMSNFHTHFYENTGAGP